MLKRLGLILWLVMILAVNILPVVLARAQGSQSEALLLTIDGPLTPAMAEYLTRGLTEAETRGAEVLVLELNTPGGSIDVMNRMVQLIRSTPVPVAVYIAPAGAMAGSAGAVITLAGHMSAMAPETSIGAASPVDESGQDLSETMEAKLKNILEATVRSLAERRGQQAVAIAQDMIASAKAVSASEAAAAGLVDFIALNVNDLLRQMDGRSVDTTVGPKTLHTANAMVVSLPPSLIEQLLGALTNPNIILLLLNVGVIAILIEISSPGGWVAGSIGVVCLALATYGLGILPVNWFGIVFIILAFVLFVLDIKAPSHGALTAAGVGSLIVGALVLFNTPNVPSFQRVSIPLVIFSSLLTGGLFFTILLFALRAQKKPVLTGRESMVGRTGTAVSDLVPAGVAQVGGERWTVELAAGEPYLPKGSQVQVVQVSGLKLLVRKAD